jgi:hypothetical protein
MISKTIFACKSRLFIDFLVAQTFQIQPFHKGLAKQAETFN